MRGTRNSASRKGCTVLDLDQGSDPANTRIWNARSCSNACKETTDMPAQPKLMTFGEGGTAFVFAALALLCIVIGAKAYTVEYSFHAFLFAAGSAAAAFAVLNRYFDRAAEPVPLFIDGKPNYNMGPVKFSTVMAMFWGIAGFTVGLWVALELAFPALNFDLPWITFGRIRPLHTSAVIFAFGGNVLIATSFYVVQRTSRARLVGDIRSEETTSELQSRLHLVCRL